MATRSVKKSRAERYREILASRGLRLEDCSVLAFSSGRSLELFHYCVMLDRRAVCYLFDGAGKQVYVVTSKAPGVWLDQERAGYEIIKAVPPHN